MSTKGLRFKVFDGIKYFSPSIFHNYLVFITQKKCIKCFNVTTQNHLWKSNGMLKKY